jgi:hypothetical protein
MNETPALPPPDEDKPAAPPPPSPRRRDLVPWVYALGFVVLAMAVLWVWQNPDATSRQAQSQQRVDTIAQQIQSLDQRVTQLAQRPEPAPVNLAPLEQRVDALEQRPVSTPDLTPIEQQIATLREQMAAKPAGAPAPDLGVLENRVSAAEQQVQAVLPLKSQLDSLAHRLANEQAELGPRLTQLVSGQQALSMRVQDLQVALKAQDASLTAQVQIMRRQVNDAVAAAEKSARLAQIETARAALDAGRPVGSVNGAAPALARFATANPPTEAALRLAFPAAAKSALDAAQPDTAGKPFGERLWQRAQQLITVREGDRVIVGDPAAGVLAHAQQELDAGDLAGAVASVSTLTGPAAQVMANWLDQAKALLAARGALDSMAARA